MTATSFRSDSSRLWSPVDRNRSSTERWLRFEQPTITEECSAVAHCGYRTICMLHEYIFIGRFCNEKFEKSQFGSSRWSVCLWLCLICLSASAVSTQKLSGAWQVSFGLGWMFTCGQEIVAWFNWLPRQCVHSDHCTALDHPRRGVTHCALSYRRAEKQVNFSFLIMFGNTLSGHCNLTKVDLHFLVNAVLHSKLWHSQLKTNILLVQRRTYWHYM